MTLLGESDRSRFADPEDTLAAIRHFQQRARVEGGNAYLEALRDFKVWRDTRDVIQDMAIAEVARRIHGAFSYVETRRYNCRNDPICQRCGGFGEIIDHEAADEFHSSWNPHEEPPIVLFDRTDTCPDCYNKGVPLGSSTISFRVATFRHRKTSIDMNLIPGRQTTRVIYGLANSATLYEEVPIDDPGYAQHRTLVDPFLVGRYPITVAQARLMELDQLSDVSREFNTQQDLPFVGCHPRDYEECCGLMGLVVPEHHALSHARDTGVLTRYYWGERINELHCWYERTSLGKLVKKGSSVELIFTGRDQPRRHSPREHDRFGLWNAFGLVDMTGNVQEVSKAFGGHYRWSGGHYRSNAAQLEASDDSTDRPDGYGFRAAANIPDL